MVHAVINGCNGCVGMLEGSSGVIEMETSEGLDESVSPGFVFTSLIHIPLEKKGRRPSGLLGPSIYLESPKVCGCHLLVLGKRKRFRFLELVFLSCFTTFPNITSFVRRRL